MPDAVFHPGHSELHGVTVVLETTGEALYVGRYHEETPAGVLLHDVAEFRAREGGPTREEFLGRPRSAQAQAFVRGEIVL